MKITAIEGVDGLGDDHGMGAGALMAWTTILGVVGWMFYSAVGRGIGAMGMSPNPGLTAEIEHGDKVTALTPQGNKVTGKATMRSRHGGWVINIGGRHGTPMLVDDSNVCSVRKVKR